MRRFSLAAGAALLLAGCGSSSQPTAPSVAPNVITFTAALSSQNEVPPITNAESGGRGTATITFNVTRDAANVITNGTATYVYSLSGFPAGAVIRATHIHNAPAGVNAGVVLDSGLTPATALTLANGTLTNQTFSNLVPGAAQGIALFQQIIDNPAGFYFNVHSNLNAGGAVRGQLVRQ